MFRVLVFTGIISCFSSCSIALKFSDKEVEIQLDNPCELKKIFSSLVF